MGNIDVYEIYDRMEKENIMLSFKGHLSEEMLHSILSVIEKKLEDFKAENKTKKRVYHVLVECLQNLFHHSKTDPDRQESIIVMVVKNATGYSVITGNYVSSADVDNLRNRIREINTMSNDDLKELYRKVLNNDTFSDKGGGGLGIIDIARKSAEKLDYGIVPVDEFNSFFSLNVKIANQ
ncbi:MAG: hypothetical protein HKN45_03430 [Flavobacteriales bacterium]|nr:hypothetical protein [Flavobacteriales bacterium]NNK81047.1 hypothetical protein [Flavobacteriales bacterium]